MGKRMDGMETWGVKAILKEAARLLHKHHRLFLPFYLAFYLTSSIAAILLTPSVTLVNNASFFKNIFTTAQGSDKVGGPVVQGIVLWTLLLVIYVLGTLGQGAVAYIVAYMYSNVDDSDDDRSTVKKVFKLLPHAFLRMLVTQLWAVLVILVLYIFSFIVGAIFYAIMSAAAGWSDPTSIVLLALLPFIAGIVFLIIMFAFAQVIAVLEPEKYGREALKRSTKLVKIGKPGTIFVIFLLSMIISVVFMYPKQAIASGSLPLWEKIILRTLISVLNSVFGVYIGVVSIVMYFVYKSRFDAVISSISESQLSSNTDSAEIPYKTLVPGNVYPTSIDEP